MIDNVPLAEVNRAPSHGGCPTEAWDLADTDAAVEIAKLVEPLGLESGCSIDFTIVSWLFAVQGTQLGHFEGDCVVGMFNSGVNFMQLHFVGFRLPSPVSVG